MSLTPEAQQKIVDRMVSRIQVVESRVVKIRKDHDCYACGVTIPKGRDAMKTLIYPGVGPDHITTVYLYTHVDSDGTCEFRAAVRD